MCEIACECKWTLICAYVLWQQHEEVAVNNNNKLLQRPALGSVHDRFRPLSAPEKMFSVTSGSYGPRSESPTLIFNASWTELCVPRSVQLLTVSCQPFKGIQLIQYHRRHNYLRETG